MKYKNVELVGIPSGMGGTLPAAVCKRMGEEVTVVCLHKEFYTNWVLTENAEDLKPFSYALTEDMKKIINSRMN